MYLTQNLFQMCFNWRAKFSKARVSILSAISSMKSTVMMFVTSWSTVHFEQESAYIPISSSEQLLKNLSLAEQLDLDERLYLHQYMVVFLDHFSS